MQEGNNTVEANGDESYGESWLMTKVVFCWQRHLLLLSLITTEMVEI
jgi:hypothetical protein